MEIALGVAPRIKTAERFVIEPGSARRNDCSGSARGGEELAGDFASLGGSPSWPRIIADSRC